MLSFGSLYCCCPLRIAASFSSALTMPSLPHRAPDHFHLPRTRTPTARPQVPCPILLWESQEFLGDKDLFLAFNSELSSSAHPLNIATPNANELRG